MRKNTISILELTQQMLWNNKINLIIESIAGQAEAANTALMSLGKKLKQSGLDPTEEDTQAALLMKSIENKGKLEKITPEDVNKLQAQLEESKDFVLESGSTTLLAIEGVGTILGNAALIHAIAVGVQKITGKKVDESKLKQKLTLFMQKVKKLTSYPAKAMESFFKFIAKSWGGGELAQEVAGVTGTLFVVLTLLSIGLLTFPSVESIIMITLSIMGFIGKAAEIFTLLKHLWHILKGHETDLEKENAKAIENAINTEWKGTAGEKEMNTTARNLSATK